MYEAIVHTGGAIVAVIVVFSIAAAAIYEPVQQRIEFRRWYKAQKTKR